MYGRGERPFVLGQKQLPVETDQLPPGGSFKAVLQTEVLNPFFQIGVHCMRGKR